MIIAISLLGVFLRTFGLSENFYFSGELGKEMLYLRQFDLAGNLPLAGMATSHEWLTYGPFYYWLMMPFYKIFSGSPYILFWTSILFSLLGFYLNYKVVSKIIDKKTALISTLLIAVSPLLIWQTRLSKLHTFFFVLSPILMFLLHKLWNLEKKYLAWTGLVYGIMFSFHFSQIPLLILIFILLLIKKYKLTDYLKLIVFILIPNLTWAFESLKILIWIPYRVIKYSAAETGGTVQALTEFFGRTLFWDKRFWSIGLFVILFLLVYFYYKNLKKFKEEFSVFYLIGSSSLVLLACVLHGAAPVHYFLPVFFVIPIIISLYITKYSYGYIVLSLLILINFQNNFIFERADDFVAYKKQIEIAKKIVTKSGESEFTLKRIGPYDYFPENYSQNYKYLIYYYGGKLIDESDNVITINEYENFNIR